MSSLKHVVTRLAAPGNYVFKSQLLRVLNKSGPPVACHPLDTEVEEYNRVLREVVVPDCMEILPDIKSPYRERIKNLILYTQPSFHVCWNYPVELMYRTVAPEDHQTEENLLKMRILRACMDLTFNNSAVLDDLADNTDVRRDKPAWHLACDGGKWAAMYDGIVLGYLPFQLIRKYFKDHPRYDLFLETLAIGNLRMYVGETLDILGLGTSPEALLSAHDYNLRFKAGYFVAMQSPLALLHAGIEDLELIQQAKRINLILGSMIQTWDDFLDYFITEDTRGEPPADLVNGGTTWVSRTAVKYFNQDQMIRFMECYGSSDPAKLEEVRRLYDAVGIPDLYLSHMKEVYRQLTPMIEALPNEDVKTAFRMLLDWLMGDVADLI